MLLRSKANSASERGSFLRIFSALRFVAIRISLSLSFSLFLSSPRFTLEAREEDDESRVLGISIERERERDSGTSIGRSSRWVGNGRSVEGLSTRFTNAEAGIIENICLSSAEKFVPSQRSKLIRDSYNVKRFPSSVFSFSNNVERSKDNPPRAIFLSDEERSSRLFSEITED